MFDGLKGGQPMYLGYKPTQSRPFMAPAATNMLYQQYAGASIPGLKLSSPKSGLNQQTSELVNMQSGIQNTYYTAVSDMQDILKKNNFDMKKAQQDERWNNSLSSLEEAKRYQDTFEKANKQVEYNKKYQISLMGNIKEKGSGNGIALTNDNRRMFLYNDPSGGVHVGREGEEKHILSAGGSMLIKDGENLVSLSQLEDPDAALKLNQHYLTNTDYANALEEISLLNIDGKVKKPVDVTVYGGNAWRTGLDTYLRDASNKFIGSATGGYGVGIGDPRQGENPGARFIQTYYGSHSSNIENLKNAALSVYDSLTDEQQKSALGQYYNENPNGDEEGFKGWFTQQAVNKMQTLRASDSKQTVGLGAGGEGLIADQSAEITNIAASTGRVSLALSGGEVPGTKRGTATRVTGDGASIGEEVGIAFEYDNAMKKHIDDNYMEAYYDNDTGKNVSTTTADAFTKGVKNVSFVVSERDGNFNFLELPKEVLDGVIVNRVNNRTFVTNEKLDDPNSALWRQSTEEGMIGTNLKKGNQDSGVGESVVPYFEAQIYANKDQYALIEAVAGNQAIRMMKEQGAIKKVDKGYLMTVMFEYPETFTKQTYGQKQQTATKPVAENTQQIFDMTQSSNNY